MPACLSSQTTEARTRSHRLLLAFDATANSVCQLASVTHVSPSVLCCASTARSRESTNEGSSRSSSGMSGGCPQRTDNRVPVPGLRLPSGGGCDATNGDGVCVVPRGCCGSLLDPLIPGQINPKATNMCVPGPEYPGSWPALCPPSAAACLLTAPSLTPFLGPSPIPSTPQPGQSL